LWLTTAKTKTTTNWTHKTNDTNKKMQLIIVIIITVMLLNPMQLRVYVPADATAWS